jgi:DNA-binding MarR family transcriptional regulator
MHNRSKKPRRQPTLQEQAYIALLKTAGRAQVFSARTIEPHGITRQQYNVLRILRGAEPEGLPTLTIAERMIEHAPGMTRMIDRLEAKGLAVRERRPRDRRCVHCRITAKGLDLLKKLDQPIEETNQAIFASLSARELGQLVQLLNQSQSNKG